ncbi:MAG: hypothetical protein IPM79_05220 [Polyangiaceae bacterium]|nr:hypothetical protein [Polyangiaceae bacterium]
MRSSAELVLALAVFVGASTGCAQETSSDEPVVEDATSLEERACPDDSYLSWENFGGPFMLTWCNGCHSESLPDGERQGAPLLSNFDTLDDVRAWAADIWEESGDHNASMPPVGGPSEEEREMLAEWLACGAPAD